MKRLMILSMATAFVMIASTIAFANIFDVPSDADMDFYGSQIGENLGFSVILGDLNADGVDDIIIGAPGYRENIEAGIHGRVYVIWGGQDDSVDLTIRTSGDFYYSWWLGYDLAIGDVNGDGIDDLLVSAPQAPSPEGESYYPDGIVFVIYGRETWTDDEIVLDPYVDPPQLADVQVYAEQYSMMYFGLRVASGDLNHDGYDDIISGQIYGGGQGDGVVYVVYGDDYAHGTEKTVPDDADLDIVGDDGSPNTSIGLGNGLASGDINGDGIDDLLMGASGPWWPYVSGGDKAGLNGSIYILYGKDGWTEANPIPIGSGGDQDVHILGVNDQSNYGYSIAVGDVNGDGIGDIISGAPYIFVPIEGKYNDGSKGMDGTVYVVYGDTNLPASIDLNTASNRDITINGESGEALHFGFSLATGDINGDCIDDILIGTNYGDNDKPRKAYAVYGSDEFEDNQVLDMPGDAEHQIRSNQSFSEYLGFDVALGDADGDRLADMLVGAPYWTTGTNDINVGAAFLVYSPETNELPVADAGPDQTAAVGDTVTLDGSDSSDPEGHELTYAWSQVSGPDVTLDGADTVNPSFKVPEYGTYIFQLVVNDCFQDSEPDEVKITVSKEEEEIPGLFGSGGCGCW